MAAVSPDATMEGLRGEARSVAVAEVPGVSSPAAIDALAFATDAASEAALREGLSHLLNPQVWDGGLRAAADVLGRGHAARLVFVDIDGVGYPAGALYELAAVCEVGTVVVAFGTAATARFTREVLLAGVGEYLVKPLDAAAVREAAARATDAAADAAREGVIAAFAGSGGSGTTTLAAASALVAAQRGRYVSVLDLGRTCPALSLLLDVEPAAGLAELLDAQVEAPQRAEMLDAMRPARAGRVAVYGYPWGAATPPRAPVPAVRALLAELARRAHLVILDGMDDPGSVQTLLAAADARVFVVEPTVSGAARAAQGLARLRPLLGRGRSLVLAQNHTRAFRGEAGAKALRRAGFRGRPPVVVPFEPTLPALSSRGLTHGVLPSATRAPIEGLVDRVFAVRGAPPSPEAAPGRRVRRPQEARKPSRSSEAPGRLRRLLPSRRRVRSA